jgi:CheY-like chemotaxis protein
MIPLATRYRPLRILCIEEDPIQRKLLEACLDVIDAESLFAPRAAQALWQFRRHPVDIVMMDLDWHVKEEIAAFEEMKKTPRWGAHVPIVAVTDNVCSWTERDYRDAGFAALYMKPIAPIRLFAKIDDVLRDCHQPPLLLGPAYGRVMSQTA